jgi:putative SOS response-associated peptidase YedK
MLSRPLGRPNTDAILLQHQPEQIIQSLLQTRFLTVGAAVNNAMEIHDRRPVVLSPELARECFHRISQKTVPKKSLVTAVSQQKILSGIPSPKTLATRAIKASI